MSHYQLNDAIYEALEPTYGPGAVNDLLLKYYQANGATANQINDAEYEYLVAAGATPAQLNDMWFEYLRGLGHTGALNDMLLQFWAPEESVESLTTESFVVITDEALDPITVPI